MQNLKEENKESEKPIYYYLP